MDAMHSSTTDPEPSFPEPTVADARPGLSERQLVFLALGGTVGSGLFIGMGQGLAAAGAGLLAAYGLAGAMVFIIARCLADMATCDRRPVPILMHTLRHIGPGAAFVQGWAYWICALLVAMAELTGAGLLMRAWRPEAPPWVFSLLGLGAIWLLNRQAVRRFGEAEFWLALIKILTVLGFLALGAGLLLWSFLPGGEHALLTRPLSGGWIPNGLAGLASALPVALFAFGGAEMIGVAAAEAANPERSVPRATNRLLGALLVFYAGSASVVLLVLPWRQVDGVVSPFVTVLSRLGVGPAASVMNVVLVTAVLSACNSTLFVASRILANLAQMGAAPAALSQRGSNGAPQRALLVSSGAILMSVFLGYLTPESVFSFLLGIAAVIGLLNWSVFLVAHLRFSGVLGRPVSIAPVPFSPASNIVVLMLVVAVLGLLASAPTFRPVLLATAVLVVGLGTVYGAFRPRLSGRREGQTISGS